MAQETIDPLAPKVLQTDYRDYSGNLLWSESMQFSRLHGVGEIMTEKGKTYRIRRVAVADHIQHVNLMAQELVGTVNIDDLLTAIRWRDEKINLLVKELAVARQDAETNCTSANHWMTKAHQLQDDLAVVMSTLYRLPTRRKLDDTRK
jgi:hypothetical protein